jgi:MtfA peptidase
VIRHWLQRLQARREAAIVKRRAIPDDLWKRTLVRYPFLRRRDAADEQELRRLTSLLLDRKEFSVVGGLKLTDMLAVSIAAQAALPALRLGPDVYDSFVGIVVHPGAVLVPRSHQDDDGVVHEYDDALAGEFVQGGPLMLSWPDVRRAGRDGSQAYNVVIHEFAHVLDAANGEPNGVPPLPAGISGAEWLRTLDDEFTRFSARTDAQEDTALDPYAAHGPDEFFAVASESFFVDPDGLHAEHPAFYELLCRFYKQDPQRERPPARRAAAGVAGKPRG